MSHVMSLYWGRWGGFGGVGWLLNEDRCAWCKNWSNLVIYLPTSHSVYYYFTETPSVLIQTVIKTRGRAALQGEGDNVAAQQVKYPDLAYKICFCLQFCTEYSGGWWLMSLYIAFFFYECINHHQEIKKKKHQKVDSQIRAFFKPTVRLQVLRAHTPADKCFVAKNYTWAFNNNIICVKRDGLALENN